MSTTQPIRCSDDIKKLKRYFLERNRYRNYVLVTLCLNTALRISDILSLRWGQVYNFSQREFYKYVRIVEQKTQKENQIVLNQIIVETLKEYLNQNPQFGKNDYLFPSQKGYNQPINRVQAYRIIHDAGTALGLEGKISCHSLRKTFGYHAWKSGAEPALLMNVYNHSSFQITKRYLGIDQEDKDLLFFKVNL